MLKDATGYRYTKKKASEISEAFSQNPTFTQFAKRG